MAKSLQALQCKDSQDLAGWVGAIYILDLGSACCEVMPFARGVPGHASRVMF